MGSEILRVLLVDGDRERCGALADALQESTITSFRVLPVWDSLDAALEKLRSHDFHVVLLDLDLPGAGGMEGLVAVRDAAPSVAVVVLADGRQEEDVVTALKLGAYDYLFREDVHRGVIERVTRHAAHRKMAEERERGAEVRYRHLFRESLDAILVMDAGGRILDANRSAVELLGARGGGLQGTSLDALLADDGDRKRLADALEERSALKDLEIRLATPGEPSRICLLSTAEHGGHGEGVRHAVLRDISAQKRSEARLLHDALHDPLTGLPNRSLLLDRLRQAVARRARDPAQHFAVVFLDLDRFKRINDTFGHLGGDEILRQVGRALAMSVRGQDTVARIGGDEFALLLDGSSREEAWETAHRILRTLSETCSLDGQHLSVAASAGVSVPGDEADAGHLLRDADTAMYRAKATGRGRVQLFDPAMRDEVDRLITQERELREAIADGRMLLFYHPIYGAVGGDLKGFEALVRWDHPTRGLLLPASFIPLAEETGLIVDLGAHVLREACRQMVEWRGAGGTSPGYVSVNVSAKQFLQPDLVERVQAILRETGVAPERVKLELTESTLMRNAERTVATLRRLRKTGLDLWIDDFGTGYSSLAYLDRFPVSAVKIERGFVASLGGKGDGGDGLVKAIVSLAGSLGLSTVAEGVETQGQLDRVRTLGADDVQGFLFSRPMTAADATLMTSTR